MRRFRERFCDPAFGRVEAQIDEVADVAWEGYIEYRKSPRTRRAGRGFADPDFELLGRVARGARGGSAPPSAGSRNRHAPSRVLLINGSARSDQTCPGEMSKTYRLAKLAQRAIARAARLRGRLPRPLAADVRVRPRHLSVQGVRVDRAAALPLAVLVLPEPRARPDAGLDERDLSALGRGARRDDRYAGQLVPGADGAEADDRPPGLRRRRQPGPDAARAARTRAREGARAGGLGLSEAPRRPRVLGGRARRRGGRRAAAAILCDWLDRHGARPGRRRAARSAATSATTSRTPRATTTSTATRDLQAEVRNAARSLVEAVRQIRRGRYVPPDAGLESPRQK